MIDQRPVPIVGANARSQRMSAACFIMSAFRVENVLGFSDANGS